MRVDLQRQILFLGNGRCYHTLDWFRSAQALSTDKSPILITDLIEGESFEKLLEADDLVETLFVLDGVLSKKQSKKADLWRNILKFMMLPFQVLKLRKLLTKYKNPIIHAHSMYYIMLARFSGCTYVATPQGSEITVRPYRSARYKYFSSIALSKASSITVDSTRMQSALFSLYGLNAEIVQNGINIEKIMRLRSEVVEREKLLSIRAITPNYQTNIILDARNNYNANIPIHFCYPFIDANYKNNLLEKMMVLDVDHGRLSREALYQLLFSTKLVLSIPVSDSSPRSVYEAIFCGAIVVATEASWITALPACMRKRVLLIDPTSDGWFAEATKIADRMKEIPYIPSEEAINLFDQKQSMLHFFNKIYPAI